MDAETGYKQNFDESDLTACSEVFSEKFPDEGAILQNFENLKQTENLNEPHQSGYSSQLQYFFCVINTCNSKKLDQIRGETAEKINYQPCLNVAFTYRFEI